MIDNGKHFDVVIIGAGILGVSIAFWLSELSDASIAIIEKETKIAQHSSSRNTGVIHRPFYLDPEKKRIFATAAQNSYSMWSKLAKKYDLPWSQKGTIEVATTDVDISTIDRYSKWAAENGMDLASEISILDSSEVRKLETEVKCAGAIYSKTDTSVDFGSFAGSVFELAVKNGVRLFNDSGVEEIDQKSEGVELHLKGRNGNSDQTIACDLMINAAGGGALDIAHRMRLGEEYTDLHFRGEYWFVDEPFASKIGRNIYSVAKYKDFPFLDPHFIVRANGQREIGPNAVLVSGPNAYRGLSSSPFQLVEKIFERPIMPKLKLFTNRKFVSLVWNEWQSSLSKKVMCERVQTFIPSLDPNLLKERGFAGIRTSLIDKKGFVSEAILVEHASSFHILNFNSPGATGAPAFSAFIVKNLINKGYFEIKRNQKHDSIWNFEEACNGFPV